MPRHHDPCRVGFDGGTTGVHVGVGAEVQLSVSREQHGFEQLVDVQVLLGGDVDEHGVATILFRDQAELGELAADLLRVGTGTSILLTATTIGTLAA